MGYQINGLRDMNAILTNERKIGGVIEASSIRLRSGEEYSNACIVNVDQLGSNYYSIGFVTEKGEKMIVNVNEISMISSPEHKKIANLNNQYYKETIRKEKFKYLARLFRVYQGNYTIHFYQEVKMILDDIGFNIEDQDLSTNISSIETELKRIS
ncbi:hypothetical protein [Bacillus sp. FJAT-47783]|uniref:hypothetical protein n=1 Tax=Bacillus sp. FJAT-47783 TaxID=2922712 RepID=UPI001FADECB3|nr:hypothetical protein [Bacillus sp. FJAT-47783]